MIEEEEWIAPWRCPWTKKQHFSFAPDFSGFDPDTGEMWAPTKIAKLMGFSLATDEVVKTACQKVIDNNPSQAEAYRKGKVNLIGFFIKAVLDETNKTADPKTAKPILESLLNI